MRLDRVAVVGLGYVGIPLASLLANRGFDVYGVDSVKVRADAVGRGALPFKGEEPGLREMLAKAVKKGALRTGTSYDELKDRDAVFVCVDTPIDASKRPDNSRLEDALTSVGRNMKKGALVVVESTLAPGTMAGTATRILERESGLKVGKGFKLAHCPERVMPGRLLYNITHYDRVVGGYDRASAQRAMAIYAKLTKGKLHPTDLTTAEIVKTAENAYRDVQIAFANEVALICEKLGADAFEVRRLVNTSPYRDMHFPGAGVGGHCLPKDPWLLAHSGKEANPRLIPTARAINDSMPFHVLDLAADALRQKRLRIEEAVVAVLGVAFLQDSDDVRNSPTVPVVASLGNAKALRIHDPYVQDFEGRKTVKSTDEALAGADLAIFMVAHKQYSRISPAKLKKAMRTAAVVDGRNIFSAEKMRKAGVVYRGVGKRLS
jgi:UDP-N-acetyl-D-mannosaminuronic acid dehydrogenase